MSYIVDHLLILVMIVPIFGLLGGCEQNTSSSSRHHAPSKSLLTKAQQIQSWGLQEHAEQLFSEVMFSSRPQKVRKQALKYWLELIESQEKMYLLQEKSPQILENFPDSSALILNKLFEHHLQNWNWQAAYQTAQKLSKHGIDKSDQLQRLKQLLNRNSLWQESFGSSDKLKGWCISNAYLYQVKYEIEQGEAVLKAHNYNPSWYHAAYYFHWSGNDSIFSFDVKIERAQLGSKLNVGLFRSPGLQGQDHLSVHFHTRGGNKNNIYHEIHFSGENRGQAARFSHSPLDTFQLEKWYRVTIDYLSTQAQPKAKIQITQRQTGKVIAEKILFFTRTFSEGPYFFGLYNNFYPSEPRLLTVASIDNLKIASLPGNIEEARESPQLSALYQANLYKIRGKEQAWREFFQTLSHPLPWEHLETRAINHFWEKNYQAYAKDLEKLLEVRKEHPNHSFFEQEIEKWQRDH